MMYYHNKSVQSYLQPMYDSDATAPRANGLDTFELKIQEHLAIIKVKIEFLNEVNINLCNCSVYLLVRHSN